MKILIRISGIVLFIIAIFLFHSCKKDKVPILTTSAITDIMGTTASSGGTITSEGSSTVIVRGICWSIAGNPTLADNITSDSAGSGSFTSHLTGLNGNTTYYVRAYATNSFGTAYGNELPFNTRETVTDIDGNIYNIITIGTQTWMVENLKTTKSNDGTPIPNFTDNSTWAGLTTGAYCDYNNTPSNSGTYGRLYNWYALDNNEYSMVASNGGKNVCPTGWHVPSSGSWAILINYLGGQQYAADKLKETGTTHWQSPNTGATNESGFTALGGGHRDPSGSFATKDELGMWWTSTLRLYTNAYAWGLGYANSTVSEYWYDRHNGFSVRCLRDF